MRFPADRFASLADHAAWHGANQRALDDRRLAETAPASVGSCAACRRAIRLLAGRCDCPDALDARARAVLHAAVAEAGLCGWSRLRLLGVSGALADRLAALAGTVSDAAEADVVVADPLPPDASAGLAAARRGLATAGCLLAALDFDPARRRGGGTRHGWDVLDLARARGFARAEILRPWSRELGYLGTGLFLLKAVAMNGGVTP